MSWVKIRASTAAFFAALAVIGVALSVGLDLFGEPSASAIDQLSREPIPSAYDPERAMGYLSQLCEFGPRPSGSDAMRRQQQYLQTFFENQGADVRLQSTTIRHPQTGESVGISNFIASFYPERPVRFLACAHYDTRPFPDRDRTNPKGIFLGANDGASGTAALMEWSHQFDSLPRMIGIDVVLFDAEEFVFGENAGEYFLGSTFFAQQYRIDPPAIPYQAGILLDMVGDKELMLLYERNSLRYARSLTKSIWATARRLGVTAFVDRTRMQEIRDDHLPLNQIARIPTTDLIDFDYPRPGFRAPQYWHTTQDVPANCDGRSLAAVVWVLDEWIRENERTSKGRR
ncbi:MAG: M28 family peptidase [Planctomycetota bacterium]